MKPSIIAKESGRKVRVPVQRTGGADGHVSVKWSTKDITAISGADYEGGEGELKFDHGETTKTIDIEIHDSKVDIFSLSKFVCFIQKLPINFMIKLKDRELYI
jgi:hypothetical protein